MGLHKALSGNDIHVTHAYTYADSVERLAATGFVAGDVGKIALQSSDQSFWILVGYSPIAWTSITAFTLTTIAPVNVTKATASAGTSVEASRQDHKHDISTGTPSSVGASNVEGSATSLARSDHVHNHGAQSDGSLHAAVIAASTSGFMTGSDKTKLDGIASGATNTPLTSTAPADVTKATAAVGVSTEAARRDHKHDISTATPSSVGTANSEGSATSLARSDHVHNHGNQAGGSLHADVIAAGASGFMTGSDKTKLDGVASGATNTPLSATAPVDVTKATASAGSAAQAAKQDHKHDISTGTPVAVGTATAEGTATSLARSDHVHTGLTRDAADFAAFTEKTSLVSTDLLLIEDSDASGVKKKVQLANLPVGTPIFGANFQQVTVNGASTTTSSTPQTKVTLTTEALTGTYRVAYCAETFVGAANKNVQVQLYNSTDAVVMCLSIHRDSATSLTCSNAGFAYVTFTGSAKTFVIQLASPDNSTTVTIQNARIELWRVS